MIFVCSVKNLAVTDNLPVYGLSIQNSGVSFDDSLLLKLLNPVAYGRGRKGRPVPDF